MYQRPLRPDELMHHGRKGQKWGVRNGPPYPIDDKVLAKGTRLNSVTGAFDPHQHPEEYKNPINQLNFLRKYVTDLYIGHNDKWVYTYRPDDKHDKNVYEGPFAKYLIMGRGAEVVLRHEMETVKDLKMPNKAERVKEFTDLVDSKKYGKQVKKDIKDVQDMLIKYRVGNSKEQERYKNFNVKKMDTSNKDDVKTAYEMFSHAMENISRYKSTQQYAKNISEKYDAMVDDNNQGIYNNAHDPIIIFRANEALKAVGENKLVSNKEKTVGTQVRSDEIIEAYNAISKELAKEGKNVKL